MIIYYVNNLIVLKYELDNTRFKVNYSCIYINSINLALTFLKSLETKFDLRSLAYYSFKGCYYIERNIFIKIA